MIYQTRLLFMWLLLPPPPPQRSPLLIQSHLKDFSAFSGMFLMANISIWTSCIFYHGHTCMGKIWFCSWVPLGLGPYLCYTTWAYMGFWLGLRWVPKGPCVLYCICLCGLELGSKWSLCGLQLDKLYATHIDHLGLQVVLVGHVDSHMLK